MNNMMHPIVANLVNQQTLYLAVKSENSAEFVHDLSINSNNPMLLSEAGRKDVFNTTLAESYGYRNQQTDLFNRTNNNVAVIPVHGSLINRFNSTWGFVTGYGYIKAAVSQALADDSVETIILDVNSNGGEAAGCFETAAFIKQSAEKKPIHAVIDSNCYSAAYAIASACTSIISTPSGGAGSIGVVAMHVSYEKLLDNWGIKATFIQAGDKKTQGNPYQDLTDAAKADIQQRINVSYGEFTKLVADNRGIDVEAVIKTQAACYTSKEAMELGLIDSIMAVEQAVEFLTKKDFDMSKSENQVVEQKATAADTNVDAATAERQRIQSIMGCEAAKEQPALAAYFAFQTNASADEAMAAMEAAKTDKAHAPVEQPKAETPVEEPNYLANAMAQNGSPQVGADNAKTAKEDDVDIAACAAFANSFDM